MMKRKPIFVCLLLFVIMTMAPCSIRAEETSSDSTMPYSNTEYGFSTSLPVNSVLIFDGKVYYDGEELDVSGGEMDEIFDGIDATGGLFYCTDYDYSYEISCSVMPVKKSEAYDWDELCEKMVEYLNNDFSSEDINAEDLESYIKYFNMDPEDIPEFMDNYFGTADYSVVEVNGYKYIKTVYKGEYPRAYVEQWSTAIGSNQYIFKMCQYQGEPVKATLVRFERIIEAYNLPPKPEKPEKPLPVPDSVQKTKDFNTILLRLTAFLIVLGVVYGIRALVDGKHKIESPVYWNPEIDYSETPFSDSSSLRAHILLRARNLSFLDRKTALGIARIKKPQMTLWYIGIQVVAVAAPVVEAILTKNWWILAFIPVGLIIPIYARRIKSWVQIVPIAVGTILPYVPVFFICLDFVIVRSLYDLWYSGVLKAAGEVLCADDELFTKAWENTAVAVMYEGEPYFQGMHILNEAQQTNATPHAVDTAIPVETEVSPEKTTEPYLQNTIQENRSDSSTVEPDSKVLISRFAKGQEDTYAQRSVEPTQMLYCNKCGQKLEPGYKFCLKCGAQIQEIPVSIKKAPSEEVAKPEPKEDAVTTSKHLSEDDVQQMRYWKQLLDDGIITESEYNDKKKTILGG